jgi:hypothetical protein
MPHFTARRFAISSVIDQPLRGVLRGVQATFTADLQIDRATLNREIDWAFELGADGVVVAMVSEFCALDTSSRASWRRSCARWSPVAVSRFMGRTAAESLLRRQVPGLFGALSLGPAGVSRDGTPTR